MPTAIASGASLIQAGSSRLDRAAHELARPGQPDPALERARDQARDERTAPQPVAMERATEGVAAWTEADVVRASVDMITAPHEAAAGATVIRQAAAAYESAVALAPDRP